MEKPVKSETKLSLTHLQYCTPERGARLLGCEVGDIYHWAGIGTINLYLDASKVTLLTGEHLLAESVSGCPLPLRHGARYERLEKRPEQIPVTLGEFVKSMGGLARYERLEEHPEQFPVTRIELPGLTEFRRPFKLKGMWQLPKMLPRCWQSGGQIELNTYTSGKTVIKFLYANTEDGGNDRAIAYEIQIDVATLRQCVLILRDDLALVQQYICGEAPFIASTGAEEQVITDLTNQLQQTEEENAALKAKLAFLNRAHPRYSPKLAAVVEAWNAYEAKTGKTSKQNLSNWLEEHADEYSGKNGKPLSGFEELAAVANWDTGGGAPKTPTKK